MQPNFSDPNPDVQQGFSDWDAQLPLSVFSMNIHTNQSTGFAPFDLLLYGGIPRLPIDVALKYPTMSILIHMPFISKNISHRQ